MATQTLGSKPAPGDRLLQALLIVAIVGVPTFFLQESLSVFVIPQVVLLWTVAVAVLLVALYRIAVTGGIERGPTVVSVASGSFLAALVVSSVLSSQTWVALTGLTVRGAGAITYGLCVGLLHAVFRLGKRRSLEPLVNAFVVVHVAVVAYALLQAYGLDPWSWTQTADKYYGPVFSTLGNSNFSAGFVALTLPLLVWVPFGSTHRPLIKVGSGAMIGASAVALSYLSAAQGYVTALVAVGVLANWVFGRDSSRPVAVLTILPVAVVVGGLPILFDDPSIGLLLIAMAVVAACAGFATKLNQLAPSTDNSDWLGNTTGRLWLWLGATLAFGTVAGIFLFRQVVEGVGSGLSNRVEYWKVALSVFKTSPIFGTGLETYSNYFTTYRSIERAVSTDVLHADSAHSIPLSILSGGGVILAITYVGVLAVVGYFGLQAVRKTDGTSRQFFGAVLAAWIGYHVQASVSIDVPGLVFTQWILGGILLAGGAQDALPTLKMPWVRQRRAGNRQVIVGAGLILVFLVLTIGPLSSPLRADMSAYQGEEAYISGSSHLAIGEFQNAIDLQPRNSDYLERLADLHEQNEMYDFVFAERQEIARLKPGNAFAAVQVARAAIRLNQLDEAGQWYERAVRQDPHGEGVLVEAAGFFAKTGSEERANQLLETFEALDSKVLPTWKVVSEIYDFLGNEKASEHAAFCAEPGQEGC